MKKSLYDYNDAHAGETIYIIGSAANLAYLNEAELKSLEEKVTIGVNFTYEGVNDLTYALSAHIAPAVYLFEHTRKKIPLFVANSGIRKQAFSYMQNFFWDDERIVEFSSDPPALPISKKRGPSDVSLQGNTSSLLLATHVALIMGASEIVYIGFEELSFAHFWHLDKKIADRMEKNIRDTLLTKKYWNEYSYSNEHSCIAMNIHKEFEYVLGEVPGFSGYFNLSEEEYNKSFAQAHLPPPQQNVRDFTQYVQYLHSINIKTYTLATQGITVNAGCEKIKTIREGKGKVKR